jgi:BirA family transcriptional regulator, biotin operon repressor / biotin---[acetyl-CoA-carboxylase] ligase
VTTRADELPVETATSVRLAGGVADRESLVKEILRSFERRYSAYVSAKGEPESVLPAYRELCETLERDVVVLLPDGASVSGIATAVDEGGMLVVRQADGVERSWSAGDVVHVRGES